MYRKLSKETIYSYRTSQQNLGDWVLIGKVHSAFTSRTRHQATKSSPRRRLSVLEFWATLDENFLGLDSSLEIEILVSNLPLCSLFLGEKKKSCHSGTNFSFKNHDCNTTQHISVVDQDIDVRLEEPHLSRPGDTARGALSKSFS